MYKILLELNYSINIIKKGRRNVEEKLLLIYGKIDKKINQKNVSINEYEIIVNSWLEILENIDNNTLNYLRTGEYIYDSLFEINELNEADFSPFVIEYCRALENELKYSLFIPYSEKINNYSSINYKKEYKILNKLKEKRLLTFLNHIRNKKIFLCLMR
jgi:hypothetical protein